MNHRLFARFVLVGVLLICVWLYLPPYADSFVGDDFVQQWRIREFVMNPTGAYQIFHPFWTTWYYRPLQNLWFLGNRLAFGLNPFGYYYLQICGQLLVVALLYRLARWLGLPVWAGLVTAVLFAINGQHHLTVSWISSIAIVLGALFSLAAAVSYLAYLNGIGRGQTRINAEIKAKIGVRPRSSASHAWLLLSFFFCLLAMLAHEEGFLAPIFLFAIWWTHPKRPSPHRADIIFFTALGLLMAGYVAVQIGRPNVHIAVERAYYDRLLNALWPGNMGQFGADVVGRWLTLEQADLSALAVNPFVGTLVAMGLLVLVGLGFWYGRRSVRLGLIWTGLHLGFIYLGLWSQRPELFDGRHLYNAWIGVSLTVGAGLAQWAQQRGSQQRERAAVVLVAALVLFLGLHGWEVERGMSRFIDLTRRVKTAEGQLKANLPTLSNEKLFAARFVLSPQYFVPAAGVWYGRPDLSGGSLDALKQYQTINRDFYLFDEVDGRLYNLAPELQAHAQTSLLWRNEPEVVWEQADTAVPLTPEDTGSDNIFIPPDDPRLAIRVTLLGEGWVSLNYQEKIPADGQLATAVRGEPGQTFHILVNGATIFTHTIQADETGWIDVLIPLTDYANETAVIQLQLSGEKDTAGFWANPRLVID
jgi:hypothetical protein